MAQLTRQQLDLQRQQQGLERKAAEDKIRQQKAQTAAEGEAAELKRQQAAADLRANLEAEQSKQQAAIAAKLKEQEQAKAEAGRPFAERYPNLALGLPWAATALSSTFPMLSNVGKKAALNRYVGKWENAGDQAYKELTAKNPSKIRSTLEVGRVNDFEDKFPQQEKRYAPGTGWGYPLAAGVVSGESALVPTEIDAMNANNPNKPGPEDWLAAASRAAIAGAGGIGASHYMGNFGYGAPVSPYTGGGGLNKAFQAKFPPPKSKGQPVTPALDQPQIAPRAVKTQPVQLPSSSSDVYMGKSPFSFDKPQPNFQPDEVTARVIRSLSGQ